MGTHQQVVHEVQVAGVEFDTYVDGDTKSSEQPERAFAIFVLPVVLLLFLF